MFQGVEAGDIAPTPAPPTPPEKKQIITKLFSCSTHSTLYTFLYTFCLLFLHCCSRVPSVVPFWVKGLSCLNKLILPYPTLPYPTPYPTPILPYPLPYTPLPHILPPTLPYPLPYPLPFPTLPYPTPYPYSASQGHD